MEKYDVLIIGAGITGCTAAERLARAGWKVLIIDEKSAVGGNCLDYVDEHGILIQRYGPHIFHTRDKDIFDYLGRFCEFSGYRHKVLSMYRGELYEIPINLNTFNKFFKVQMDSAQMKAFLEEKRVKLQEITNSRDTVVSKIGIELYEAFIAGYTKKQWDAYPEELDSSLLARLPIRYDKDDLYFSGQYQGMPIGGFTKMMQRMVESPNITLLLDTEYREFLKRNEVEYKWLICTAPIDSFFDYILGKLKYRSLNFQFETLDAEQFQSSSVINYAEESVPYTRITEFKHFYGTESRKTTIMREIATWDGQPMYPVPMKEAKELYGRYQKLAENQQRVRFAGRLGVYKYLDIDTACKEALELAEKMIQEEGNALPKGT